MAEVKRRQQIGNQAAIGRFIQRDAERTVVVLAQIDVAFAGRIGDLSSGVRAAFAKPNANRVKDRSIADGPYAPAARVL